MTNTAADLQAALPVGRFLLPKYLCHQFVRGSNHLRSHHRREGRQVSCMDLAVSQITASVEDFAMIVLSRSKNAALRIGNGS